MPNPVTDFLKNRYFNPTSAAGPVKPGGLGQIAKDIGVAGALYGIINPNDSSGLADFFGTGGRQQPIGYTGGIPNYNATRELVPNAFAQTYTTPTGEIAPRRPGATGRRYFTDTTFTQDASTPFMGITAEQIAAQNQAAQDERDLFESILGSVETEGAAAAAAAADTATTDTTGTTTTDTTGTATTGTTAATTGAATGTTFPEGTDGNGVVSNSVLDGFGEVVNTTGTGQLTSAQLKQAVLDGTMDYNTAYGLLGIADAANPFGFTEDEKLALGISESQRTGQGYKQNPTTGAMDLYDYDTGTFVTARERFTELLDTQVDESDGIDADEQKLIADSITEGGFGIDEIATRYDAQPIDVIEGLLRGDFQTPEQIAAMSPQIDEPMLIATLLDQGKTTPEEVAAYYKDHPVYGGITPEQVIAAFKDLGGSREFAQGGNVNGYYLGGPTDGMADQIPATINNMQPAALSDGEFVIPADVVSHLGNGNSDAGAKNLYSMMDRIREDRTGTTEQGRQIDPNKYLA